MVVPLECLAVTGCAMSVFKYRSIQLYGRGRGSRVEDQDHVTRGRARVSSEQSKWVCLKFEAMFSLTIKGGHGFGSHEAHPYI
jgi:hypothetical protein